MVRTQTVSDASDLRSFCSLPGSGPLQSDAVDGDEHLLARDGADAQARCSLWWRTTPRYEGRRLGYVGHFAARTAGAAADLLEHSCGRLADASCTLAVGPIDGSTWKRYRLLTERGDEPLFFLEPDNPDEWPSYFSAAGFSPLAHYTSARDDDLHASDPRAAAAAQRMRSLDVRIRQMNPSDFAAEVNRIFDVSLVSFQKAFLYSPIGRSECFALYEPLKRFIRPELVLIAERRAAPVGFIFAVPDWLQAQRGSTINTIVIKTVAILPDQKLAGLGALLVAQCRQKAAELGYVRAIHALMHDQNVGSKRISDRFGKTMRGYTLFSRRISR